MASDNSTDALDRRSFIKASSSGIGAVALAAASASSARAEDLAPSHWDTETDVAVLGYGGAGACAAIAAHDAGANVLVIEKQAETTHFPNTRMAGGIWHCPDADGDREALKQYAKALMSGENLPWKLEGEEPEISDQFAEIWARESPTIIDFLRSIDPEFKPFRAGGPAFPDFPGARASRYRTYLSSYQSTVDQTRATRDLPKSEKVNGEALFAAFQTGVSSRKIRVLYETPATDFIVGTQGEIIGVVASQNGKTLRIKAKRAVVLATGGFEYNVAMREAFLEGPGVKGWAFSGTPANTGDGIAMAMRVGAGLAKVGKCAAGLTVSVPSGVDGMMTGVGRQGIGLPNSMMVDNYGARFIDETLVSRDPSRYFFYKEALRFNVLTLDYPRCPSWLIFDETFCNTTTLADVGFGPVGAGMVPWSKDNKDAVKRGWILSADTIEALGTKIKAHPDNRKLFDPAALTKAVARYNEVCSAGKDGDFGRMTVSLGPVQQAPYYAAPLYVGGPNTKGGIMANAERQAVDWNWRPIPRLYTAGEISSAFKFVYQAGGNLTECMVFGRIAGRNAAAQAPWS